jgi:hypothetical protein
MVISKDALSELDSLPSGSFTSGGGRGLPEGSETSSLP